MEKFDFTTLEMNTFITEGKECLATEILKNLYCESHNLSLRSSCAKILLSYIL